MEQSLNQIYVYTYVYTYMYYIYIYMYVYMRSCRMFTTTTSLAQGLLVGALVRGAPGPRRIVVLLALEVEVRHLRHQGGLLCGPDTPCLWSWSQEITNRDY